MVKKILTFKNCKNTLCEALYTLKEVELKKNFTCPLCKAKYFKGKK